jgi:hypothetical protein
MTDTACRLSAIVAVEHDPVRRAERLADLRLAAAVTLAPRLIVCEALLAGLEIPAARLVPAWVRELHLQGDIVLDDALALAVVARGPIETSERRRRAA